ncbi:MAG: pseudouridine synthase [Paracoccaceae bacterium]|tara:strand:+ start:372 stop:914 length:543 start_codon:yes stop_codon:yes gene_type:complete
MLLKFNKPFNVMSQFSDNSIRANERGNLSDFISIPNIYPIGRLDKDSEGLMLLSDDGKLQHNLSNPKNKIKKTYYVQVEGKPKKSDLDVLRAGMVLKDGVTRPAEVKIIDPPNIWKRIPPIRVRKTVPDTWLELIISEGKNRQIRRMTAAVGYPTLRLVRTKIDSFALDNLMPGEFQIIR